MIEVLTPIWERVLQLSSIGVDENFFDLGGDSILAVNLFSEIEQVCGLQLPPVMIYHAPTIATLAAQMEQPTASPFPPLVLLKAGTGAPPIFIAHGLGGSVIDFFQLVRHIQTQQPIYGMQARGIDGVDEPFDRIEDLAQFYLDAIKEVQPHGPYFLIGYSLGGLVTLEMAQHLSQEGEQVALLAMLETYPYSGFLPLGQRVHLVSRVVKDRIYALAKLPLRDALAQLVMPPKRRFYISKNGSGSVWNRPPSGVAATPALQRARESAYRALIQYRPRAYSGKIKFVRAEIITDFPSDPASVWANLAAQFEVDTVPGDHLGILGTEFASLASVLSRYLRELPQEG
jgi:thioesterase domain-containing protein/acyl carrier protein